MHKPTALSPSARQDGVIYPLAADHRTTVSLSFRPTSSCSGKDRKKVHERLSHCLPPSFRHPPLTSLSAPWRDYVNSHDKKRTFPSLL